MNPPFLDIVQKSQMGSPRDIKKLRKEIFPTPQ